MGKLFYQYGIPRGSAFCTLYFGFLHKCIDSEDGTRSAGSAYHALSCAYRSGAFSGQSVGRYHLLV